MPGPYSAGSIFVAVIPSFKDNQRDIAREYAKRGEEASKQFAEGFDKQIQKDLPKAMEKSARSTRQSQATAGEEAGKSYGKGFRDTLLASLKSAEKDLENISGGGKGIEIPVGMDPQKFRNKYNALVRDISLTRADLEVGADVGQAIFDVDRLMNKLRDLRDASVNPEIRTSLTAARGALETGAARARKNAGLDPEPPTPRAPKQLGAFDRGIQSRLQSAVQTLPPVVLDADTSPAMRKIAEFRQDAFRFLDDLEAEVDLDSDDTLARARALMTLLEEVIETADPEVEVGTSFNAAGALAQLQAWEKAVSPVEVPVTPEMGYFRAAVVNSLKAAGAALPEIPLDVDATDAQRDMAAIRTQLLELGERVKVGLDMEEARKEARDLYDQLGKLRKQNVELDIDVDSARAIIELEKIERAAHDAERDLRGVRNAADDGANSFRAFSAAVLGVASLGPLAIPVIGAIAGGLAVAGPLALAGAAGLGVFALGIMGVADAVGAMGDVQTNAAKDAETYADGVRNAGRSLADAEESLADARRSAATSAVRSQQQVERALRGVRDAEENLGDAQRDAQRAQEGLTRAREEASDRLLDLQLQLRGGALAERRAIMQLAEAQTEYNNAAADPGATRTEREQLLLSLEEQKLRVDEVKLSNSRLAEEQAEANRTGIEGSDEVVAAQERIRSANDRVADAQVAVADAVTEVAQAQADSQRAAADSARTIAQAQLRVADAQADYADAVAQTSSSQDKLAESMAKLSPAGRDFAEYLFSLKPYFKELRDAASGGLLPGLQEWMQRTIGTYGPQFVSIVGGMSQALGDMFRGFGEALQSPEWASFFDMLESKGPVFIGQIGDVLTNLGTGLASLTVAFAPAAEDFGNSMVGASEKFADWAAGLSETQGFREFMEWWERVGPKVVEFFWALVDAIGNVAVALAPYAEDLMVVVTALLNFIGDMDPQALGAIIVAIAGVTVAFQALVGLNALITGFSIITGAASAAMAYFAGTAALTTAAVLGIVAIVLAALVVIGVGLYLLWQNSETFRDIVIASWEAIKEAAMVVADWFMAYVMPVLQDVWEAIAAGAVWLWETILVPIFEVWQVVFAHLMDWMKLLWDEVGWPLFELIWTVAQELWQILEPIFVLIGMAFAELWHMLVTIWQGIGQPLWDWIIDAVIFLWDSVFDPVITWIMEAWGWLFDYIVSIWDTVGKPVFDVIQAIVEALVGIFQGSFDGIAGIWNALVDLFLAPIRFVVETVMNKGLIAGVNHIASIFTDDDTWVPDIPTGWIDQAGSFAKSFAPGRAYGGPIPGSSPHKRADNVPIMATAGEYMHDVDATQFWGIDFMEDVNRRNVAGVLGKLGVGGYAYGGLIDPMWNAVKKRFPTTARLTSHYRPGDPGYHGKRQAIDIGGSRPYPDPVGMRDMLAINRFIGQTFGAQELIHTAPGAMNLYGNKPHTYGLGTQADHRNHVHWALQSLAQMMAGSSGLAGSMGYDDNSPWGKISDFMAAPLDFLKNIVSNFAGPIAGNPLGKMLLDIPLDIADNLVGPLQSFLGIFDGAEDPYSAGAHSGLGVGARDAQTKVQQVAAQYGWGSGAQWSALLRLVEKESGWNYNAANPTSSARGLFQKMTSIHGPLERTIEGQAGWGLKYIADRYGDPIRALQFHNRNNWYSRGGLIEGVGLTPYLHDDGGTIDPGWNLIYNATRKPEASLNPTQLENIQSIADNGGGRGDTSIILQKVSDEYTPEAYAQAMLHAHRRISRGGVHSGDN